MSPEITPVKVPPPVPWWLKPSTTDPNRVALYDAAGQYCVSSKDGTVIFESNAGPQTWSLLCPYDEIVIGGKRGGGKSKCLTAWMANGDLSLPGNDPARASFLQDKSFRGLFLREEYASLVEFIEEAVGFFKPLGAKVTGGASKPVVLDFESGAKIYFNHLKDESAFEKYKGWNITRIGIEELTQVPTLRRYLKLLGSLRSVERVRIDERSRASYRFPALRTQIMSTTNPDGPGATWVKARFVEVSAKGGGFVPWNNPMLDKVTGLTRIFIPFGVEANPYLSEDTPAGKRYRSMLLSQDEVTRRQWMEGDWSAGTGKYFKEFRPFGPIGEEEHDKYPWAKHVVTGTRLQPWWYRWCAGDWGYDHPAAFHKFCRNETDKRVHVYDELCLRHVGSFEMGALLAKWWHPELLAMKHAGGDPMVTIYLGADAFAKDDATKTKAQQIEAGIKEVLGPYGAILLKYDEDEQDAMRRDPKRAQRMFDARKKELLGHMCIALKPVYVDRTAAWGYVRDWLRFRPAVLPLQTPKDRDEYLLSVYQSEGSIAYEMQAAALRDIKPEILPKVQIWDVCKGLIRCMEMAQHDSSADDDPARVSKREDVRKFNADDEGKNGDDELESFRNGAIAYREIETTMPQSYWVAERMAEIQSDVAVATGTEITDINRLMQMQRCQAALYNKQATPSGGAVNLPRAATMRHRSVQ